MIANNYARVESVRNYLRNGIANGQHLEMECPELPLGDLADRRAEFSRSDFWLLQLEFCYFYWYLSQFMRPRDVQNLMSVAYDLLQPRDNDYPTLRDTFQICRTCFN